MSVDTSIENSGWASLMGRVSGAGTGYGTGFQAYFLTLDTTGVWGFHAGTGANSGNTAENANSLASGKATLTAGAWHNMKLVFSGTSIRGLIDGTQVFSITDGTYKAGQVGLGTQSQGGKYTTAYFDNLIVNTVGGAPSSPTSFPQDAQRGTGGAAGAGGQGGAGAGGGNSGMAGSRQTGSGGTAGASGVAGGHGAGGSNGGGGALGSGGAQSAGGATGHGGGPGGGGSGVTAQEAAVVVVPKAGTAASQGRAACRPPAEGGIPGRGAPRHPVNRHRADAAAPYPGTAEPTATRMLVSQSG